jgi:mannose/fructose-specific phosphotransferase system component IIA
MTRVLLVGHGQLASATAEVARGIVREPVELAAFDVDQQRPIDELEAALAKWLGDQSADREALLLTDLPGATPHNLAVRAAADHGIPVVSGFSLGMLLRALNHADAPPDQLAVAAAEGGRRAVVLETGR